MGDKSKIEWTDASWNPVTGCSKVSPGCAHCYAEELHRTRFDGQHGYPPFRPWTPNNASENVVMRHDRLDQPLRWTKPRLVFVNSMADLFHEEVTARFIAEVFAVMARASTHTFQVLTKRPERMAKLLRDPEFVSEVLGLIDEPLSGEIWPLPNVWVGTSIENLRFVDRADHLRETPAAVRFISAEPLLGPLVSIDVDGDVLEAGEGPSCGTCGADEAVYLIGGEPYCVECPMPPDLDLTDIDWLIVGGESGPKHRPIKPEWVRSLRDAAVTNSTAFFFKQWGGHTPKAGGRELDGRTWDEMPQVTPSNTQEGTE